jgi:hypothetical protein
MDRSSDGVFERASGRWAWRALPLATLAAFNLLTFNRYFPLSEGWWETYGYLYNSGLRPYRDFDLAFTPLFTLVNAGLLRLFGDSFFAIRLLGVGVFLCAVLALQLLLERLSSPRASAVAVLVATFLVIFEPQFIAKDYHLWQLLLVALALLLHVHLAVAADLSPRRRLGGTALLGALVTLVFLLKQNVGGLLLAAIAASLPLVDRRRPLARLAAYGAGVALTLLAALPVVSPSEWRQLLLANDAKGSLGTVLLRFWQEELNRRPLTLALEMAIAVVVARRVFAPPTRWTGIWSDEFGAFLRRSNDEVGAFVRRPVVRRAAFVALVVAVAASGNAIRKAALPWIIPVTLALLALAAWHVASGLLGRGRAPDPRAAALVLPLGALAYANTTTAAFDFNGMHVVVAIAIAALLAAVEGWAPPRWWYVAALALAVIVPEIFAAKLRVPYAWWGHRQPSVFSAVHEPAYQQLRGMYVSAEYRDALDAVKRDVDEHSRSRSDAFFYNLPALYWLHGKLPPTRTVVQWFDVVSSRALDADLQTLERSPPRIVVALEPMPAAYAANRSLKGTDHLPQEDFRALMDRWVEDGTFRLVRSIALPGTRRAGEIEQEIVVQNQRAIGESLEALLRAGGPDWDSLEVRLRLPAATAREAGGVLRAGDVVEVEGELADVRRLSELLGIARGDSRDWHTVNVYVRADEAAARAVPAP